MREWLQSPSGLYHNFLSLFWPLLGGYAVWGAFFADSTRTVSFDPARRVLTVVQQDPFRTKTFTCAVTRGTQFRSYKHGGGPDAAPWWEVKFASSEYGELYIARFEFEEDAQAVVFEANCALERV